MRCPHCGEENARNAVFCQKCDAWILASVYENDPIHPQQEPAAGETVSRKRKKYWMSIIAVALVAAMCLSVALWPQAQDPGQSTGPSVTVPETTQASIRFSEDYVYSQGYIEALYYNNALSVLVDDTVTTYENYLQAMSTTTSLDGKAAACLLEDGTLLYIRDGTVTEVSNNAQSYVLSVSGAALVYMEADGTLWKHQDGDRSLVYYPDIYTISDYDISPDGSAVAYVTHMYTSGLELKDELYLLRDNKTDYLGAFYSLQIQGVADGGDWVYVLSKGVLYTVNTHNITVLGEVAIDVDYVVFPIGASAIRFNADHRQVMYYLNDGTYLSVDGKEGIKISEHYLQIILPEMTSKYSDGYTVTYPHRDLLGKLYLTFNPYQVPDFMDAIIIASAKVFRVNDDMTMTKFCEAVTCWLDPGGRYLYMTLSSGELMRLDLENETENVIAADVRKFWVSYNCSRVFYVSGDLLYCCDGEGGDPVQLGEAPAGSEYMTCDGVFCYLIDGMLATYGQELVCNMSVSGVRELVLADNGRLYVTNTVILFLMEGEIPRHLFTHGAIKYG